MKHCKRYGIVFAIVLCSWGSIVGQDITVHGGFLEDSVSVGKEATFYLSARYASTLNIIFPDTTYAFTPFEFRKKEFFPTRTRDGKSYDSVLYYVTTFEVDSFQRLALPIFLLTKKDSTVYKSNYDSIRINQVVKSMPDSLTIALPLQATVAYQDVSTEFNYPLFIIIGMVVIMVTAVAWFLTGEKIQRYFRLRQMRRAHLHFVKQYTEQVHHTQKTFSVQTAETALTLWKRYMEQLHTKPYTKLTTREILTVEKNTTLGQHLRTLDSAIYGYNNNVVDALENLKQFAEQQFNQKIEEVKHG